MTDETDVQPIDVGTELAHRIIRAEARDGTDPFMIHGHPGVNGARDQVVRACFYYAVTCSPKLTVLYDNWGEGGMCKMIPHEWRAMWKTPELLAALGTTYEQLRDGTAVLNDAPVPPADVGMDQLTEIVEGGTKHGWKLPEDEEAASAPAP